MNIIKDAQALLKGMGDKELTKDNNLGWLDAFLWLLKDCENKGITISPEVYGQIIAGLSAGLICMGLENE